MITRIGETIYNDELYNIRYGEGAFTRALKTLRDRYCNLKHDLSIQCADYLIAFEFMNQNTRARLAMQHQMFRQYPSLALIDRQLELHNERIVELSLGPRDQYEEDRSRSTWTLFIGIQIELEDHSEERRYARENLAPTVANERTGTSS
jgi:hypothetical protein